MATTQTATVGRISAPLGWNGLIIGIAIGALAAGMFAAWLATRDGGAELAAADVSSYTLAKVLETETIETASQGPQVAVQSAPAADGFSYTLGKVAQVQFLDGTFVAPSDYSLAKVEQVKEAGTTGFAGESTAPAFEEVPGAGMSGSPHLLGLVE